MSTHGDYNSHPGGRSSGSSHTDGRESRDPSTIQDYGRQQHSSDVPQASIERSPSPSSAYERHDTRDNDAQADGSRGYHENAPSPPPGFERDHNRSTGPEPRRAGTGARTSHFQVYDDEGNAESRSRRSAAPPSESNPSRALRNRQDRNAPHGEENSSERTQSPEDQPRNSRESSGNTGTAFSDW
ncbi:hypothetical protein EYC84_009907 [Monilinia fructicola]|uniref:Uncharacterized protein n=1 Tax=Monilinia fructicola TaxID=38448 RepID=A0A5M9JB20_MONFR|nr:hypothetical protein EYC84_009907 [Monilinia fructicola]